MDVDNGALYMTWDMPSYKQGGRIGPLVNLQLFYSLPTLYSTTVYTAETAY